MRKLSLDRRIAIADVAPLDKREAVRSWLLHACDQLQVTPEVAAVLKGAVFEVRQGYKSKDSKRQNADIANAASAYSQGYLPAVVILSTQIDADVAARYTSQKWLILRGVLNGSSTQSTYTFCREVVGYDLAGFFQRNSAKLKNAIDHLLKTLLTAK